MRRLAPVFLTWNDSRRSRSLSARLGLRRVVHSAERRGLARHALGVLDTARFLITERPVDLWYQFSLLLGLAVAAYASLRRGRVRAVVDLHTKALRRDGGALQFIVLPLKRWALRRCQLAVVTNAENARYAREVLGIADPCIVPDPPPEPPAGGVAGVEPADVVFVCSFAPDEPLALIADAARRLEGAACVVTGNTARLAPHARQQLARVARLPGFLPEEQYWALLRGAGCVVVLSTEPACLPCGAYEALAVGHRPVLAADAEARMVFGRSARYTALEPERLVAAIREAIAERATDPEDRQSHREAYEARWMRVWQDVRARLELTHG